MREEQAELLDLPQAKPGGGHAGRHESSHNAGGREIRLSHRQAPHDQVGFARCHGYHRQTHGCWRRPGRRGTTGVGGERYLIVEGPAM